MGGSGPRLDLDQANAAFRAGANHSVGGGEADQNRELINVI